MEYLYLDGELYLVSKPDMENVNHAIGNCCGSCCPETLQELRRVFTDIKRRYKAFEVEGPHTTPYEQFDPTSARESLIDFLGFRDKIFFEENDVTSNEEIVDSYMKSINEKDRSV